MIKIGDKFINKRTSKQYELKKYKNNKYALLESFNATIWDCYDSIKEANTDKVELHDMNVIYYM